jgi:hypothetical protein
MFVFQTRLEFPKEQKKGANLWVAQKSGELVENIEFALKLQGYDAKKLVEAYAGIIGTQSTDSARLGVLKQFKEAKPQKKPSAYDLQGARAAWGAARETVGQIRAIDNSAAVDFQNALDNEPQAHPLDLYNSLVLREEQFRMVPVPKKK